MIIYRKEDRITIKINKLTVKLAPLSYEEKATAETLILENTQRSSMDGSIYAVKCAVKDIKGLKLPDGSDYELEFENNILTDKCIDDLTNIEGNNELFIACLGLLNGVPSEFINPLTGEKLEGVEIVKEKSEKKAGKKSGS